MTTSSPTRTNGASSPRWKKNAAAPDVKSSSPLLRTMPTRMNRLGPSLTIIVLRRFHLPIESSLNFSNIMPHTCCHMDIVSRFLESEEMKLHAAACQHPRQNFKISSPEHALLHSFID